MSESGEIPADIHETADAVWLAALDDGTPDAVGIIARAILAERERAAKIAERTHATFTAIAIRRPD